MILTGCPQVLHWYGQALQTGIANCKGRKFMLKTTLHQVSAAQLETLHLHFSALSREMDQDVERAVYKYSYEALRKRMCYQRLATSEEGNRIR